MQIALGVLIVVIATLLFALCGGSDDPAPAPSDLTATSTAAAVSTEAPGPAESTTPTPAAPDSTAATPTATTAAQAGCEAGDGREEALEAAVPLTTVVLRITEAGSLVREFTYDEFADLEYACVDLSGPTGDANNGDQSGPLLIALLQEAGYSAFTEIEIVGVISTNFDVAISATATLAEASQPGWLVTIDRDGRVRFPDPRGASRDDWIGAISEIAVTP
jgi:hypothetical protein